MTIQEVNKCKCGSYDEWQPCSPDGVEMEPDMSWNGFYICMNCGNVELLIDCSLGCLPPDVDGNPLCGCTK